MESKMIDQRLKLEQLPTQELADMLQRETGKEIPDDDLVLLILDILEKRDADKPVVLGPKSQAAWETYQAKSRARGRKPVLRLNWIIRAASFLLIAGILAGTMLPKQTTAGSFWKILTSWTQDLFQYKNIGEKESAPEEYVFKTDNPGLQQVYDAVVEELEILEPVVPMWLPGEPGLVDLLIIETPAKKCVQAIFADGEKEIVLIFDKMIKDLSPTYYKTDSQVQEFERGGIKHFFVPNNDCWIITWARQNVKCSIRIDCQEEVLKEIVKTIY